MKRWQTLFLLVFIPIVGISTGLVLAYANNEGATPSKVVNNDIPKKEQPTQPVVIQKNTKVATQQSTPENLLVYTNEQRAKYGLQPLVLNTLLNDSAQTKAEHMKLNNYWAHIAPDGTTPWFFFTNAGYSYSKAGENLACGFSDAESVITGWMNSPTHRANILTPEYTEVGFGIVSANSYRCGSFNESKQTIIVQHLALPY